MFNKNIIIGYISVFRNTEKSNINIISYSTNMDIITVKYLIKGDFFSSTIDIKMSEYKKLQRSHRLSKILN